MRRFGGDGGVDCSGSIGRSSEAGIDEEVGIGYIWIRYIKVSNKSYKKKKTKTEKVKLTAEEEGGASELWSEVFSDSSLRTDEPGADVAAVSIEKSLFGKVTAMDGRINK